MEDMPEMPEVCGNFDYYEVVSCVWKNLINGVLDYSRIGKVLIENQLTDLKKMLHEIVETIVPAEGYKFILQTIFLKLKLQEYFSRFSLILSVMP
jgi:hypothetical protein